MPLVILHGQSKREYVEQLPEHAVVQISAATPDALIHAIPTHCSIMLMDARLTRPLFSPVIITRLPLPENINDRILRHTHITLGQSITSNQLDQLSCLTQKSITIAKHFYNLRITKIHPNNTVHNFTLSGRGAVLTACKALLVVNHSDPTDQIFRDIKNVFKPYHQLLIHHIPTKYLRSIASHIVIDKLTPDDVVSTCNDLQKTITLRGSIPQATLDRITHSRIRINQSTSPDTIQRLSPGVCVEIAACTHGDAIQTLHDHRIVLDKTVSASLVKKQPKTITIVIEHLNESTIKQLVSHRITRFCINRHTLLHAITPLVQHAKHNPNSTVTWNRQLKISGTVSDVVAQAIPADREIILAKNAHLSIDAFTAKQRFLITVNTPVSLLTGVYAQHVFVAPNTVFSKYSAPKGIERLKALIMHGNIALAHLVATNCCPHNMPSGMRFIIGTQCYLSDQIRATMVITKETPPDLLPSTHNVPSVELVDIEEANIPLLPERVYKVSEYIHPSVLERLRGFCIQPSLRIQAVKACDAETVNAIDLYHTHSKTKDASTRIARTYGTLSKLEDDSLCISLEGPKRQCQQEDASTHTTEEANDPPIKQETGDAHASSHRSGINIEHAEHAKNSASPSDVKNQNEKTSTPTSKHWSQSERMTTPKRARSASVYPSHDTQLAAGSTPASNTTTHPSPIPGSGFFKETTKTTPVKQEI